MTSNLKMELRWLVSRGERVLQYRQQYLQTQYSMFNEKSGDYLKSVAWSEWIDVPEFDPLTAIVVEEKSVVYDNNDAILDGIEGENE